MSKPKRVVFSGLVASVLAVLTGLNVVPPTSTPTQQAESQEPPVAQVIPRQLEEHGQVRVDDYYWLNERENPEVIIYLEAENAYTEAVMAHTQELQELLFGEIKGRIKQTDLSVPFKEGDYFYYYRTEDGKEYRTYARKKGSLDSAEELLLDVNEVAEGHGFTSVRWPEISSGQNIMAFAVDTVGRRIYTIRFQNLDTGEMLDDEISTVTGNLEWANDNRTLFYTRQDPVGMSEHTAGVRFNGNAWSQNRVRVPEPTDNPVGIKAFAETEDLEETPRAVETIVTACEPFRGQLCRSDTVLGRAANVKRLRHRSEIDADS